MKPVEFPEHNVVFAKDQPEYLPLPAFTDERHCVSCWSLTWRERFALLLTGRLWLTQLNFGQALQPQLPSVETPFVGTVERPARRGLRRILDWRWRVAG